MRDGARQAVYAGAAAPAAAARASGPRREFSLISRSSKTVRALRLRRRSVSATLRPGLEWRRETAKGHRTRHSPGRGGRGYGCDVIEGPIDEIVTAVLDHPVAAVDLKPALGAGPGGRTAGDASGELIGEVAGVLVHYLPLDEASLSEVEEVEVAVEGAGHRDGTGFDAAVTAGSFAQSVPWAGGEGALEVDEERPMIAFDAEVGVPEAAAHELCDGALSQQRIGGDVLVRKAPGLEQRDGGFDLVGVLEGIRTSRYGWEADFFWE